MNLKRKQFGRCTQAQRMPILLVPEFLHRDSLGARKVGKTFLDVQGPTCTGRALNSYPGTDLDYLKRDRELSLRGRDTVMQPGRLSLPGIGDPSRLSDVNMNFGVNRFC